MCLFDAVQIIDDALTGAYLCAGAAAGALCLVYLGYAALNVYGVVGAFFGAAAAGDTGLHAGCPGFAPAVGIAAGDDHGLVHRLESYYAPGTDICTLSAGNALLLVDMCQAVSDLYCSECAGLSAVPQANTGKTAHLGAAGKTGCGSAAGISIIVIALLCYAAVSLADDTGDLALLCFGRNAHYGGYGLGALSAGGGTPVYGGLTGHYGISEGIAASVTAGAAIGTAQACTHRLNAGIHFYLKFFIGNGKYNAEQHTQHDHNAGRKKYSSNVHLFSPFYIIRGR